MDVFGTAKSFFMPEMIFGSDAAEKAAKDAAKIAASSQQNALDYIKEVEALPQAFRQGALEKLGGLYGLSAPVNPQEAEDWYMKMNPDITPETWSGGKTGREHYEMYGKAEGRKWPTAEDLAGPEGTEGTGGQQDLID